MPLDAAGGAMDASADAPGVDSGDAGYVTTTTTTTTTTSDADCAFAPHAVDGSPSAVGAVLVALTALAMMRARRRA